MTARVWVAPVGTCATCGASPCGCPPDDAPAPGEPVGAWTELGVTDEFAFAPLTGTDICLAMGVDERLLGPLRGHVVEVSMALARAEFRRLRQLLLGRRSGPPPLAAGALAASTLARKRGGRRG